jgi:Ca2+/Na+ antiporter
MRDSLFYLIAILCMIIVIIDGKVYWYEALFFIILYILYIIAMLQNSKIESWSYAHISFLGKIINKILPHLLMTLFFT